MSGEDRYDFFVVNRVTGEPVTDARVVIYKLTGNWRNSTLTQVTSLPVNRLGLAVYNKEVPNRTFTTLLQGTITGCSCTASLTPTSGNVVRRRLNGLSPLYSPIERFTVWSDGLLQSRLDKEDEKGVRAVSGQLIEPTLYDANDRELSRHRATTNGYGSVSGEFTLPRDCFPGTSG